MKTIELFFIGEDFYYKSGTHMSSIYEAKTGERSDWGKVSCFCREGITVIIRPATESELTEKFSELGKLLISIDNKKSK